MDKEHRQQGAKAKQARQIQPVKVVRKPQNAAVPKVIKQDPVKQKMVKAPSKFEEAMIEDHN
jgi:hypothetical protein